MRDDADHDELDEELDLEPAEPLAPPTPSLTAHRIAVVFAVAFGGFFLFLGVMVLMNLERVDGPDQYIGIGFAVLMLAIGLSVIVGIFLPSKTKDPNAPIEIPPLDQVRGRTRYRDDRAWTRNVMIAVGTIFLVVSLSAARDQPLVLVFALVSVGVLAGAGVLIWRQIQYGRSRLELAGPARRGDAMHGVITTSGFGWTVVDREFHAYVRLDALRHYSSGKRSTSVVVASERGRVNATRDGKDMTMRFTIQIPIVDTSEGRFSWNVILETESPVYEATFSVDVA